MTVHYRTDALEVHDFDGDILHGVLRRLTTYADRTKCPLFGGGTEQTA
jgi:hypothetical protein